MKKISTSVYLLIALAAGLINSSAIAQDKTVRKVPARPTVALDGRSLFNQYCAVCHGQDARGGGPAASALKTNPSDLTQISRRNGGKFPEERVLEQLRGGAGIPAHGSEEMPIWGAIFSNMSGSLSQSQTRMHGLVSYLEDLQAK